MPRRILGRLGVAVLAAAASAVVYATVGGAATKSAPVAQSSPTISGAPVQGNTLTASSGSWSGSGNTYAYEWDRCDSSGGSCAAIGSASSPTYTVQSADVGHTLLVVVTATNSDGSAQTSSAPTGVVTASGSSGSSGSAPSNTKAPAITGTLNVGQALTVNAGTWTGATPITFTYEWQRCNGQGVNCSPIGVSSSTTYTLQQADLGNRIQVKVYARNSAGESTKYSNQTTVIGAGSGPTNTKAPEISGTVAQGQKLTVSAGTWTGVAPISFSYEWQRCNAQGQNCTPIGGATAAAYTVQAADVGNKLQVKVTASNSGGASSKYSNQTGAVAGGGPAPAPAPSGGTIAAAAVALPNRLTVNSIKFPQGGHPRTPFQARFHVVDGSGRSVSGALVYVVGLPYKWIRAVPEAATDATGWATFTLNPTTKMPLRTALVLFVRARTPQGDKLAGASTRRLVQVHVRP